MSVLFRMRNHYLQKALTSRVLTLSKHGFGTTLKQLKTPVSPWQSIDQDMEVVPLDFGDAALELGSLPAGCGVAQP